MLSIYQFNYSKQNVVSKQTIKIANKKVPTPAVTLLFYEIFQIGWRDCVT